MSLRSVANFGVIIGLMGATACTTVQPGEASPSICDAMDAEMGGCDSDLPEFAGQDCDALAAEFGQILDVRTVQILQGPADVNGNGRSVRLKHQMVLLATLVGRRLDELEMRGTCQPAEFLDTAEAQFSDELRGTVGNALYDGSPSATYDEWRDELLLTLALIDIERE